jgi:hypothetical protein
MNAANPANGNQKDDPEPPKLPPRPAWFVPTFTAWEVPDEIPCAKTIPRTANTIASAFWAFAPGMERITEYRLSSNRGRKHLILWAGARNESGGGWTFVPVAYGPSKSPDGEAMHEWHAALHLLAAAWASEKRQTMGFEPPQEIRGPLDWDEFLAICRKVWPEYESNG